MRSRIALEEPRLCGSQSIGEVAWKSSNSAKFQACPSRHAVGRTDEGELNGGVERVDVKQLVHRTRAQRQSLQEARALVMSERSGDRSPSRTESTLCRPNFLRGESSPRGEDV